MRYFYIRHFKVNWHAWDILDRVEGPLYTKDALYSHCSIKDVLFTLETLNNQTWFDMGIIINIDFDFNGNFIEIKDENE